MTFKELADKRCSIREFAEGPIDHETLVAVLKEAQRSPSWKNTQTARAYIVESGEKLKELRSKGLPAFNQKSSANAALIVSTYVKAVSGHTKGEPDNELGDKWGVYDLGLRDAFLTLAAAEKGLGTLIMGIRDAAAIRELLAIPEDEEIVSVIAIGKPAGDGAVRPRKELEEVVKFF